MANKKEPIITADAYDEDGGLQIVTFAIEDETFAFVMSSVLEIIRIPTTVDVPLTAPTLVGLANLRGGVLPIIDLRMLLGFNCSELSEHSRVVVVDTQERGRVGLIVDCVSQVKTIETSSIDNSAQVESVVSKDMLIGVIKNGDEESVVPLLDALKILEGDFSEIMSAQSDTSIHHQNNSELLSDDEDGVSDNQLVSFEINHQEYAFDLMCVEEIVRIPSNIAQLPNASSYNVGLIELRGKLLPLLCLSSMMGMPAKEHNDTSRIVIISIKSLDNQDIFAGFIVDQMREVLRVSNQELEALPTLMKNDDEYITNICQFDSGQRLVSILSAEHLFGHPTLKDAITEQTIQESQMQTHNSHVDDEDLQDDNTEQLVVFLLENQEYAISIDHVQEITRLPAKMDKVPKTQAFVEGLVNLRGTVLPVLDMRTRFGLTRMEHNERQRIIVLAHNNTRTGFIVDAVLQVLRLPKDHIEASPNLSAEQARVMGKIVNLKNEKRIIQVLEVDELLSDTELKALNSEAA
ncbi:MAG: chemotaxis protein CheW [Glaciecola sp.]